LVTKGSSAKAPLAVAMTAIAHATPVATRSLSLKLSDRIHPRPATAAAVPMTRPSVTAAGVRRLGHQDNFRKPSNIRAPATCLGNKQGRGNTVNTFSLELK
jgi:hypothetical protein